MPIRGALLALRFVLEIGSLVALAYWGFTTGGNAGADIVLGVGAPVLAAVVWWLFVSPKAKYGSALRQAVFEALVFGAAVLALFHAGRPGLALVFGTIALVGGILLRLLDPDLSPA